MGQDRETSGRDAGGQGTESSGGVRGHGESGEACMARATALWGSKTQRVFSLWRRASNQGVSSKAVLGREGRPAASAMAEASHCGWNAGDGGVPGISVGWGDPRQHHD